MSFGCAGPAGPQGDAGAPGENGADGIDAAWVQGRQRVGVTAGASAPEVLVDAVVNRLRDLGASTVRPLSGVEESVVFPLPKGLGKVAA